MKLMRALLLGSMLFVLIALLVTVFGVRALPESAPVDDGQVKAVLLSSGSFAPPSHSTIKQSDPVDLASLTDRPARRNVAEGGEQDTALKSFLPTRAAPTVPVIATALPTQALQVQASQPLQPFDATLDRFASQLVDGEASRVVGVYVQNILQLEVDQQPPTDPLFVNPQFGVATEFGRASLNGVVGLLAHNTSSGILFYQIHLNDHVEVVYGDDHIERYQVRSISEFQKLDTLSPMSDFVDLATGATLSSTEVFNRFYSGARHLTLQTCLEHNGDPNWGLHFIEAYPVP